MRLPLPTRSLLGAFGLAGVIMLAEGIVHGALAAGLTLDVALIILVVVEIVRSVSRDDIRAVRELPSRLYTSTTNSIAIAVENHSLAALSVRVRDDWPCGFGIDSDELSLAVAPGRRAIVHYRVTAPGRGTAAFGDIVLRWYSPMGLLAWQSIWPQPEERRVYPRFMDFGRFEIEQRARLRRAPGSQRRRAVVRGGDFESLRDYVSGDDTRRIDWKATARHDRLISRNYEEERSKTILVMVDAGRMMAPVADGLSKLDHAINAALMLCSAALAHADRIGLVVFSHAIERYLPPRNDKAQASRMMEALYDVQPRLVEPDYAGAFAFLNNHHRRRSLVVLITDLIDEAASDALLAGVAALRPAHLPLLVTIRDESVERAAVAELATASNTYRRAVAEEILEDRSSALFKLRARGVVVVDAAPASISVATVNQYLALKHENRV